MEGAPPLEWLRSVGYGVYEVCNRILSSRFRGRCPSCWPAYIASMPRPVAGRPLSEDMPLLDEVLSARVRLLWGSCLNAALSGIVAHRDSRAWMDFPLLPSLVLLLPASGGSSRTTLHQRDKAAVPGLVEWVPSSGTPSLRSSSSRASTNKPPASLEPSFDLDDRTASRVHTLIEEGALRRACTALTADSPVSPTPAVIDELRLLHPVPTPAHRDMIEKLRPVS